MPEIIQCPACGKETYRELPQCPHCGEPFSPVANRPAEPLEADRFRFGAVVTGAFTVFFGNILHFVTLAIIILSPLLLLDLLAGFRGLEAPPMPQQASAMTVLGILGLVSPVLQFLLFSLLTATITFGAFQALRGRDVRVGDCLSRGLSRFLPVIGVSIASGLAAGLAFAIFLVPAFTLSSKGSAADGLSLSATIWIAAGVMVAIVVIISLWVAVPATVVERKGVFASLRRSAQLTRGCRWMIFGTLLFFAVLSIIFTFVFSYAVFNLIIGPTTQMSNRLEIAVALFTVLMFIGNALAMSFGSVLTGVCYYELRRAKEGTDVEQIAAVFD